MFKSNKKRTKKFDKINLWRLFDESKRMVVFLPDEVTESFKIVRYLQSWFDGFAEINFYAPLFQIAFLQNMKLKKLINVSDISQAKRNFQDTVILYFSNEKEFAKLLNKCHKSLVLSPYSSQVIFDPAPSDSITYLQQFAQISGIANESVQDELILNISEPGSFHSNFIQNNFPNFILHFVKSRGRNMMNLLLYVKNSFSANVYFTAVGCKAKDIPNIKTILKPDLLTVYKLASAGDMLLTDDIELHNLLEILKLKSILIKDIKDLTNLKGRIISRQKGMS